MEVIKKAMDLSLAPSQLSDTVFLMVQAQNKAYKILHIISSSVFILDWEKRREKYKTSWKNHNQGSCLPFVKPVIKEIHFFWRRSILMATTLQYEP